MARPLLQIQEEIRRLSVSDKEQLLRVLWEELDGATDAGVDDAWLEEAQRRDRDIDDGVVETVPAAEVFDRLRSSLPK